MNETFTYQVTLPKLSLPTPTLNPGDYSCRLYGHIKSQRDSTAENTMSLTTQRTGPLVATLAEPDYKFLMRNNELENLQCREVA